MKATGAYLAGVQKIQLRERDLEPGPDQILVKTHLAGICGTDKNFYEGIFPKMKGLDTETRKDLSKPFFFGHEGGGTVVETGGKVTRFRRGDKVIAFGWVDTFADHFVAGENDLEPVPAGMDMDLACLGEPIGCAVFSGLQSRVQLGDTVAVFGMGFAGQIMAQVVRKKGAFRVIAVDVVDDKLMIARQLGADVAINNRREDPVEAILEITGGKGVDVAVEMAGTQEAVNQCTAAVPQRHPGFLQLDHPGCNTQYLPLAQQQPSHRQYRPGSPFHGGAKNLDTHCAAAGHSGPGTGYPSDHPPIPHESGCRGI